MTIHNTSGDPEAIVVNAKPQDVETFLRLSRWLSGLQTELDRSWAVLGEIYGLQSHNNLNLLGLKIRRVKSNIDDVFAFSKTVPYVPARIAFEAENADLLKLLVAPLYSDEPGIGIRELIQNAIDAVREFEDTAARHPDVAMVDRYQQASDVRLDVQCDKDGLPTEVIVTDRGSGMTAEIIRDYFLKAGASFRRSNAWRREHEDSKGHSRVLRTGRFGVGALAAFLLGDEIEVTTRHAFSAPDEGVTFTARLDDEALSLNRVRCPVGTKISIKVPERARKRVSSIVPSSWAKEISYVDDAGHYFLKRPSLSRHFSGRKELPPAGWLPQIEDVVSREWRCFSTPAFEKIFWSYDRNLSSMACNGIVISGGEGSDSLWRYLRVPNIAVFGKDGSLPVNLQRTGLQGPLPFRDDLLRSIGEDIAAHALVEGPRNAESGWLFGAYEGLQRGNVYGPAANRDWSKWLIGRDGYILNEPSLVFRFRPALLVIVVGGDADHKSWGEAIRLSLPPTPVVPSHSVTVTCTITNAEPYRAELCILTGKEWHFRSQHGGSDVNVAEIVDHPGCAAEISLDPGAAHRWETTVEVPDNVSSGTLALELSVLRGPRNSQGLYPPERSTLESEPIAIVIGEAASKANR
jgi:hypothetical protein